MTTIVSVVGQKGGVGKTTISRLLAVETIRAGHTVRIVDLDPGQGSVTKWKLRRDQADIQPDVDVEKCRTVEAAQRRVDMSDVLIMDGPAYADKLTAQMAKAADLVIIPTGYGIDDLDPQIQTVYDLEDKGIASERIKLVFCHASPKMSEEEDQEARRFLKKAGVSVFDGALREMKCIRKAHNNGLAASETGFPTVDLSAQRLGAEMLQQALQHKKELT